MSHSHSFGGRSLLGRSRNRWWYLPLLWFCALQAVAQGSPDQDRAARHEQGRELYNYRCYYCHGYSGDAKTLASSFMLPPPRNFQATSLASLSRESMVEAVTDGRPGTAMVSFTHYLSAAEIGIVVDFIRQEFMAEGKINTRYHTVENGWPNHERYRIAFPFATGEIPLDYPQEQMTAVQREGLRLFSTSCVSCHDRAAVEDEGEIWELMSISYPRNNFSYTNFDGVTSASVYAEHDQPLVIEGLSDQEREGEKLWLDNCAFCHAANGTGKNWIGSFLDSHPRDLTDPAFMVAMDKQSLRVKIEDGLKGTSMPAWKHVLTESQIDALIAYISRAFHPVRGVAGVAE